MSYKRVIPRDLFNEADLLKLCGKLWIALESHPNSVRFTPESVDRFEIEQDPSSGAIYLANISLQVLGGTFRLERPLNTREPWSLFLSEGVGFEVRVFDDNGALSPEFSKLVLNLT